MQQLIAGYRRFRAGPWPSQRDRYESLSAGQAPRVCVISCCDSRVDPVSIFDALPGDLFVIRNVANLVPPYRAGEGYQGTSTAIEFAVRNLNVELIMVLGHARCGGVKAALDGSVAQDAEFLRHWVGLFDAARARVGPADAEQLERESIKVSLERLRTFPFVAQALRSGRLALAGARFSIFDGRLEVLDSNGGFTYVDEDSR